MTESPAEKPAPSAVQRYLKPWLAARKAENNTVALEAAAAEAEAEAMVAELGANALDDESAAIDTEAEVKAEAIRAKLRRVYPLYSGPPRLPLEAAPRDVLLSHNDGGLVISETTAEGFPVRGIVVSGRRDNLGLITDVLWQVVEESLSRGCPHNMLFYRTTTESSSGEERVVGIVVPRQSQVRVVL